MRNRFLYALATLPVLFPGGAIGADGPPSPEAAQVEIGRGIYERGILADGSPLRALRPEGFVLEGEQAACTTCHRESGMGTVEGSLKESVLVPPVTGPLLFTPALFHGGVLDSGHHWVPNAAWERALKRSAYDGATLARALRQGLDPDGRPLVAPMPRYALDDASAQALEAYLRQLSAAPSPGVDARTLHLALVTTPDAPPGHRQTVQAVTRAWVARSRALGKEWRLHPWELRGTPDTWSDQLAAHYRRQPVFALLSGAGGARWEPVHRFCETHHVACVLPALEVAPGAPGGRYAVYFSPGVTLEARVLASHLLGSRERGPGNAGRIRQLYADLSGERAAERLHARLQAAGWPVAERRFDARDPAEAVRGMGEADLLVLWLRPAQVQALLNAIPAEDIPKEIFLSALLAPPQRLNLPAHWRTRVTYVSLADDLGVQGEIAHLRLRRWLKGAGVPGDGDPRVAADAYAACYLLSAAFAEIEREEARRPEAPLTREHLLEKLERVVTKYGDGSDLVNTDSHVVAYGRMSLGPGQRVAVRGGILLRYAGAQSRRLVAVGRRIVPLD